MNKIFLTVAFLTIFLNFQVYVLAQENTAMEGEITVYNEDCETSRALPTDVKTVTMTQVGTQVIPGDPLKEDLVQNAEVLYRYRYKVTAQRYNGQLVTNLPISYITYTGPIKGQKFTAIDSSGVGYIDIDVRGSKYFEVKCSVGNMISNIIKTTPAVKARYERTFYCTGYNTALESDYSGTKIDAPGIADAKFIQDFLNATRLNGSGLALSGKYLHFNSGTNSFQYYDPTTATGTKPTPGRTIAVDPYFIPRAKVGSVWKRAKVNIAGIGERTAEDGGKDIVGYKIDVYMGLGKNAMIGWGNASRSVTLISVN